MRRIRDAELLAMPEAKRRQALADLVAATKLAPNGELVELNEEITGFEKRRGMTSAEMRSELEAGRIFETREICQWLMALKLRDRLASLSSR